MAVRKGYIMENWKRMIYQGEDLGDYYEVSDLGNIRNAKTKRVIKTHKNPKGYLIYAGSIKKKSRAFRIHKAIAETFIDMPDEEKIFVSHINGDRTDNRVCNLMWASPSDTAKSAYANSSRVPSDASKKKVAQLDKKTLMVIREYDSVVDAARALGNYDYNKHISDVCTGKRKSAYGFKWEFVD